MTTNHPTLSNARLATFKRIEFVLVLKNKTLLDTVVFLNNGIPIHGGPILWFFMTVTNGVQ
jgi:hypothetical protein